MMGSTSSQAFISYNTQPDNHNESYVSGVGEFQNLMMDNLGVE